MSKEKNENEEVETEEEAKDETGSDVIPDDRETKVITTSEDEHEVEVYTYLTGHDERALKKLMYDLLDPSPGKNEEEIIEEGTRKMGGEQLLQQEDVYIRAVVRSVNGESEDIVDRVLNMRKSDYQEIMDHVEEVAGLKQTPEEDNS